MAVNREIACIFYECEGECLKGREGTFRKSCQTCKDYKAQKGGRPARKNLRKEKMAKANERDVKRMMRDY